MLSPKVRVIDDDITNALSEMMTAFNFMIGRKSYDSDLLRGLVLILEEKLPVIKPLTSKDGELWIGDLKRRSERDHRTNRARERERESRSVIFESLKGTIEKKTPLNLQSRRKKNSRRFFRS